MAASTTHASCPVCPLITFIHVIALNCLKLSLAFGYITLFLLLLLLNYSHHTLVSRHFQFFHNSFLEEQ